MPRPAVYYKRPGPPFPFAHTGNLSAVQIANSEHEVNGDPQDTAFRRGALLRMARNGRIGFGRTGVQPPATRPKATPVRLNRTGRSPGVMMPWPGPVWSTRNPVSTLVGA